MARYIQEDLEGTEDCFEELTLLFGSAPELQKQLKNFWLERSEPNEVTRLGLGGKKTIREIQTAFIKEIVARRREMKTMKWERYLPVRAVIDGPSGPWLPHQKSIVGF